MRHLWNYKPPGSFVPQMLEGKWTHLRPTSHLQQEQQQEKKPLNRISIISNKIGKFTPYNSRYMSYKFPSLISSFKHTVKLS